jgi:hypothetical protein
MPERAVRAMGSLYEWLQRANSTVVQSLLQIIHYWSAPLFEVYQSDSAITGRKRKNSNI